MAIDSVFGETRRLKPPVDLFRIRAIVPHFEASVADYKASSAVTRKRLAAQLDVAYGAGVDEKLDLFFPDGSAEAKGRPIHLFVHGGYWRANSKDDYSYIAEAIVAAGAIAAIVDYSLMPHARMDRLVDQVRRAARWLGGHAEEFGGDPCAISASGHSAGGHLATYLCCRGPHEAEFPDISVRSILSVSGLYDLAPIATSFLQLEIGLTPQEIAHWSPCDAIARPDAAIRLVVGGRETTPFFEQAGRFAGRLASLGLQPRLASLDEEDHMTIVRSLGRVDSVCAKHLAAAIAASHV
jgi:arylformamidase